MTIQVDTNHHDFQLAVSLHELFHFFLKQQPVTAHWIYTGIPNNPDLDVNLKLAKKL